jgi:hypothetical protein
MGSSPDEGSPRFVARAVLVTESKTRREPTSLAIQTFDEEYLLEIPDRLEPLGMSGRFELDNPRR